MNKEKQAVVLGALLHDIGKFMQRAEVPCRYLNDENEMQRVCKYNKQGGYFSHKHSLWTVDFFEKYGLRFPLLLSAFENPDDNLANFASKHHNPDTPLQWIIAEADRLSSGMDRMPADEEDQLKGKDRYKKVRLYPVLEEIMLEKKQKGHIPHRIELNPLTLDREFIFPRSRQRLRPKEDELLVEQYNSLWLGFIKEFALLPNESFLGFIESLLFLLEKYSWCIPSSTIDLPADISLFDHCKTTAAIAACLYDYHRSHDNLEERNITDRGKVKYALVCGDISGIQKFIYNITAKGAAKGLKGRSFFLQLLSEASGKYILREFRYPLTNLLYASGGKFYLLIADLYEQEIKKISREINRELIKKYDAEIFLSLGFCSFKGNDFEGVNFPPIWKKAAQQANEQKSRKFSGLDYKEIFELSGRGGLEETCEICKREGEIKPRRLDEPEIKLCQDCQEMENLGERLSRAEYLMEVFDKEDELNQQALEIPFLNTRYYLLRDLSKIKHRHIKNGAVYKLNSTDFLEQGFQNSPLAFGFKFIGGTYLPRDEEQKPMTFNDFADRSTGLKRLGILRMDVDNLGRVFSQGFGQRASISRVTTLSRSLSLFFNGYLNTICQKGDYRDRTFIIYSGGDDLFVIGAWDRITDLAVEINTEFREFCCHNPALTLSGGIALTTKKYPIYRGAKHAGDAEEKAKRYKGKNGKEKDAITFLDKTLSWHDMVIARHMKESLYKWIAKGKPAKGDGKNKKLSKGILDRLRKLFLLYEVNRTYWEGKRELSCDLIEERLKYHKWAWRSVYSLDKAMKENELFHEELWALQDALFENQFNGLRSEREVIEFIDVPTRWAEFLLREEA
ncbi:MAG: type III-A CRISPR-associated protein Cas10/Csm1 [Deltaproteobacteria bacterium]|nr:MAG: type III-A CRISPR-associated protein Cas10/Csm1 [Deltaproteobacteria bacterium]